MSPDTDLETRYQSSLDWIYSFTNLEKNRKKPLFLNEAKLNKIGYLMSELGNRHSSFKSIHIAGSKGKGSVSYLLASYYQSSGLKTGLYTSPHLFDVTERIMINSVSIGKSEFVTYTDKLREVVGKIRDDALIPTFFDLLTALAFLWFADEQIDVGIIETGLGGRLDSTNIVLPVCSVITSISYEHTDILGTRIEQIAAEKAGIIKDGVPVVISANSTTVRRVLKKTAAIHSAELYYAPSLFRCIRARYDSVGGQIFQTVEVKNVRQKKTDPFLCRLLGDYQRSNCELFLSVISVAAEKGLPAFNPDRIATVLKKAEWPGRCTIDRIWGKLVLIDGAHNGESARQLAKTLISLSKMTGFTGKGAFIIGMMKDKDHLGILKSLYPLMGCVVFIVADKWKEAGVENFLPVFEKLNRRNIPYTVLNDPDLPFEAAMKSATDSCSSFGFNHIIVTGSLYVAAKAMRFINAYNGRFNSRLQ